MLNALGLSETLNVEQAQRQAHLQELAELATQMKPKPNEILPSLSAYIDKVWSRNKDANLKVRQEMLSNLRRCRGEYEAKKLTAIRQLRGSEAFVRVVENKCRAAESWIKDIYRGEKDLPYVIEPTAMPDLPDETKQSIQQEVVRQMSELEQQLLAIQATSGIEPNYEELAKKANELQFALTDKAVQEMQQEAKRRCSRASDIIRDQNQEAGFNTAFKNFLWYFTRTKAACLKGPVLVKKPKQVWQRGPLGWEIKTEHVLGIDVYAVSPFNLFPEEGMTNPNDGDIIEIHELSRQAISDLIGVPDYNEEAIRKVLDEFGSGELKPKWIIIEDDTEVKRVEKDPKSINLYTPSEKIQAMEFYGTVSGKLLIEWGVGGDIDEAKQYQTNCWKIGKHVIKAVVNPDSLGRKPYHISSWSKSPSWIWGEGLTEIAATLEDILNAITRALQNNIGIASGPQVVKNKDFCDDNTPLTPWKIWEATSQQMKEGKPVDFWQASMNAGELINAWQFFAKLLDEMTVPAYAQGASQSGVTAGTATVFTQLLAAASRSIKAVIANIDDDVITPYIQMCYDYNMKFTEDDSIKGDARVVAKGVQGLLVKEQAAQRKVEFLNIAANPMISQLLGAKNLGAIVAQIAKSNDIELPEMSRLEGDDSQEALLQMFAMAQAGMGDQLNGQVSAGGTPPNQQAIDGDGSPMGTPEMQRPM